MDNVLTNHPFSFLVKKDYRTLYLWYGLELKYLYGVLIIQNE